MRFLGSKKMLNTLYKRRWLEGFGHDLNDDLG